MDNKKIGIASDHAGYQLKEFVIGYLDSKGYDVYDFGTNSEESCDYPDYAHPLAEAIEKGELPRGIAMCGSANGITMTLRHIPLHFHAAFAYLKFVCKHKSMCKQSYFSHSSVFIKKADP